MGRVRAPRWGYGDGVMEPRAHALGYYNPPPWGYKNELPNEDNGITEPQAHALGSYNPQLWGHKKRCAIGRIIGPALKVYISRFVKHRHCWFIRAEPQGGNL